MAETSQHICLLAPELVAENFERLGSYIAALAANEGVEMASLRSREGDRIEVRLIRGKAAVSR